MFRESEMCVVMGVRGLENQRCVRAEGAEFRKSEIYALRGVRGSENQRCVQLGVYGV